MTPSTKAESVFDQIERDREDGAEATGHSELKKLAWKMVFGENCIKTPQRAVIVCRAVEFAREAAPHFLPATPLRNVLDASGPGDDLKAVSALEGRDG